MLLLLYLSGIFIVSSMSNPTQYVHIKVWDKLAHFSEYIPVGLLLALWFKSLFRQMHFTAIIMMVFIMLVLLGIFDEFHQSFVPRRDPSVWDILADTLGGLAGALIALTFIIRKVK